MKKLLLSLLLLSSAASYSMGTIGTCGGGRGELISSAVGATLPIVATTSALASTGVIACNPSVLPTIFGIPTLCKAAIGAGISFASSPAALLAVPVLVGVGTYKLIKYNTPAEKKN